MIIKMSSYFEIYMNQLFSTLGQLTAILVSGAVAVPMMYYYGNYDVFNYLNNSKRTEESESEDDDVKNEQDEVEVVKREEYNKLFDRLSK